MSLAFENQLFRKLDRFEIIPHGVHRGGQIGHRRSPSRGTGLEFADHKEYSAGDDIRYHRLERLRPPGRGLRQNLRAGGGPAGLRPAGQVGVDGRGPADQGSLRGQPGGGAGVRRIGQPGPRAGVAVHRRAGGVDQDPAGQDAHLRGAGLAGHDASGPDRPGGGHRVVLRGDGAGGDACS